MLKKKLFGILILIVGITLVFSLSGCRLDKLLDGLIPDEKDDYEDYPDGYGPDDYSSYNLNGTWEFYLKDGQSATITITGSYSWTLTGSETTITGTLTSYGNSASLYDSSYTEIGTAEMTGNTSMKLTLVSPSEMAGIYYPTKRY